MCVAMLSEKAPMLVFTVSLVILSHSFQSQCSKDSWNHMKSNFLIHARCLHTIWYMFYCLISIRTSSSEPLRLFLLFLLLHCFLCFHSLSLCAWFFGKDIPPVTSCMSRLSNLYTKSVKKLRSSHLSKSRCVWISSPPAYTIISLL